MKTIHQSRLLEMLENDAEAEVALREYFVMTTGEAFAFSYQLRSDVTVINDVSDSEYEGFVLTAALRAVNGYHKRNRRKYFDRLIMERCDAPVIVSEGDSWFNHPYLKVTVDCLYEYYNIRSLGEAGDTLRRMTQPATREYLDVISELRPVAFIFSGIGNDILGNLFQVLKKNDTGELRENPRDHLSKGYVEALRNGLHTYRSVATELQRINPEMPMFVHGYDYALPGAGKRCPWLKKPMDALLIPEQQQPDVVRIMIDELNRGLELLSRETPNLYYVDCRNAAPQPWDDEIHPSEAGYREVAQRFHHAIQSHFG
ncbi:MAG: SGNH/GDSL hydrolase family protein [Verrucomicrobiales bacterium]|nr:SGNH/GDSL hydrolase family protein [Verrucomicrobiales bacterium]